MGARLETRRNARHRLVGRRDPRADIELVANRNEGRHHVSLTSARRTPNQWRERVGRSHVDHTSDRSRAGRISGTVAVAWQWLGSGTRRFHPRRGRATRLTSSCRYKVVGRGDQRLHRRQRLRWAGWLFPRCPVLSGLRVWIPLPSTKAPRGAGVTNHWASLSKR